MPSTPNTAVITLPGSYPRGVRPPDGYNPSPLNPPRDYYVTRKEVEVLKDLGAGGIEDLATVTELARSAAARADEAAGKADETGRAVEELSSRVDQVAGESASSCRQLGDAIAETSRESVQRDGEIASSLEQVSGALRDEVSRARAEETRLAGQIDDIRLNVESTVSGLVSAGLADVENELTGIASGLEEVEGSVSDEESRAKSAEAALQEQINRNEQSIEDVKSGKIAVDEAIENRFKANEAAIEAETARATDAEQALSGRVDAVNSALEAETARATEAEQTLSGRVDTVSQSLSGRVDAVNTALEAETARATEAEQALSGRVDTVSQSLSGRVDAVNTALEAETARATEAEQALSGRVTAVNTALEAETVRATDAEQTLSGRVTAVNSALEAETVRATDAEQALSGRVDTVSQSLSGRVDTVDAALEAEVTRATEAEQALSESMAAKADLVDGKVPLEQIPEIPPGGTEEIREYSSFERFPSKGATGILYLALDTNRLYRWTGSRYLEVSPSVLLLGETAETAFPGDRGLRVEQRVEQLVGDYDETYRRMDNHVFYTDDNPVKLVPSVDEDGDFDPDQVFSIQTACTDDGKTTTAELGFLGYDAGSDGDYQVHVKAKTLGLEAHCVEDEHNRVSSVSLEDGGVHLGQKLYPDFIVDDTREWAIHSSDITMNPEGHVAVYGEQIELNQRRQDNLSYPSSCIRLLYEGSIGIESHGNNEEPGEITVDTGTVSCFADSISWGPFSGYWDSREPGVTWTLGQSEHYDEPHCTLRRVYSDIDDVETRMYEYDEEGNVVCGYTNYQYPDTLFYLEGTASIASFAQVNNGPWGLGIRSLEGEEIDVGVWGVTLTGNQSLSEYWPGNTHVKEGCFDAYLGSFQNSGEFPGVMNAWPNPDEYGIGASELSYFWVYDENTGEPVEQEGLDSAWAFKATKHGVYYGQESVDGDMYNRSLMEIGSGQTIITNAGNSTPMIDIGVCFDTHGRSTRLSGIPGTIGMTASFVNEDGMYENARVDADAYSGVYISADRDDGYGVIDGLYSRLSVETQCISLSSVQSDGGEEVCGTEISADVNQCCIGAQYCFIDAYQNLACSAASDVQFDAGGTVSMCGSGGSSSLTLGDHAMITGSASVDINSPYFVNLLTDNACVTVQPDGVQLMTFYYFWDDCACFLGGCELCTDVVIEGDPENGGPTTRTPIGARLSLGGSEGWSASLIASEYDWGAEREGPGYAFAVKSDGSYTFRDIADAESDVTFTLTDFRAVKDTVSMFDKNTIDHLKGMEVSDMTQEQRFEVLGFFLQEYFATKEKIKGVTG